MVKQDDKLITFLKATKSPSPVNIIIYDEDSVDMEYLQTQLSLNGYHEVHGLMDLAKRLSLNTRLAVYTENMNGKEIINSLSQINSGSAKFIDNKNNQILESKVINASVIFISSKQQLSRLQKKGFKILENTQLSVQI